MAIEGRCAATEAMGPENGRPGSSPSSRFLPLTRLQRAGLFGFLLVSAVDVVLSALLFFGGGGGYVEANPLLAWASGGLFLFLVAVLAVKAIGVGLIAVLVSFANRFCTLAGDAVLFAALCTTLALFIMELVTVGVVPSLEFLHAAASLPHWYP
ncbi:MAG: hypothetical protein ABFC38_07200 [Methanospirillum sp.]